MIRIIIFILVVVLYVGVYVNAANRNRRRQNPEDRPVRKRRKASAVPNRPRVRRSRKKENVGQQDPVKRICTYDAAYSKGKPSRIGRRGDYETVVPAGMVKVVCGYCGAENFVPEGDSGHYHCFFCWEKL